MAASNGSSGGAPVDAEQIAAGRRRFEQRAGTEDTPPRRTLSGTPLAPVYGPDDRRAPGVDSPGFERIGWPGEFPFTRGLYDPAIAASRGPIRQFAGFGSASDTNARFRQLLDGGGHGLSVAFDMPTLMGLDSDHPKSRGEVGHCGVAVDSAIDMVRAVPWHPAGRRHDVDDDQRSGRARCSAATSSRPNEPVSLGDLAGTLQTDIFKEYIAQKEWLFPPGAAPSPDR